MLYMISYDLVAKPESAYENLFALIQTQWKAIRVLKSQWLVQSTWTARQVHDAIKPHIDAGKDRLFVTELTRNLYGTNLLNAGVALNNLINVGARS